MRFNKQQTQFRASVKTSPAIREEARRTLEALMVGVPVKVVEGFTAVEPLPTSNQSR